MTPRFCAIFGDLCKMILYSTHDLAGTRSQVSCAQTASPTRKKPIRPGANCRYIGYNLAGKGGPATVPHFLWDLPDVFCQFIKPMTIANEL